MKDSTAAKVVSVIVNIITAAGSVFLCLIGCLFTVPFRIFMGPYTIDGNNFRIGILVFIISILLPIAVNLLLSKLHKKFGVSKKWAIVPTVIISSAILLLILIYVISVGDGFSTARWNW